MRNRGKGMPFLTPVQQTPSPLEANPCDSAMVALPILGCRDGMPASILRMNHLAHGL